MHKTYLFLSLLLIVALSFNSKAQSGHIDPTFNPGTGVDDYIEYFYRQQTNKTFVQ